MRKVNSSLNSAIALASPFAPGPALALVEPSTRPYDAVAEAAAVALPVGDTAPLVQVVAPRGHDVLKTVPSASRLVAEADTIKVAFAWALKTTAQLMMLRLAMAHQLSL